MDSNLAEALETAREIAADTPDMAARMAITALVTYVENINRAFYGGTND